MSKNEAEAQYEKAMDLVDKNQVDAAELFFRKAVELEPDNAWYQCMLGWCLLELYQSDEAEPFFRKAAKLEPDNPDYRWWLGVCLRVQGKESDPDD